MNPATEKAGELHPVSLEQGKLKEKFDKLQSFYESCYPELRKNLVRKLVVVWLCLFTFLLPALSLNVFLIRNPWFTSTTEYSALLVVLAFAFPLWIAGIIMLYGFLMRQIQRINKLPDAGPEFMKLLDDFSEHYFRCQEKGFYDSLVYNGTKDTGQSEAILSYLWLPIRSIALYSKSSADEGKSVQLLFIEDKIELWEGVFPNPELSDKSNANNLPRI